MLYELMRKWEHFAITDIRPYKPAEWILLFQIYNDLNLPPVRRQIKIIIYYVVIKNVILRLLYKLESKLLNKDNFYRLVNI